MGLPELVSRLPDTAVVERKFLSRDHSFGPASFDDKLSDTERRLRDLDAAGVTVQVLSYPGPGADLLPARRRLGEAGERYDRPARRRAT